MNFQAVFPSSDKEQRMLTLSKHLQFPQAIQQVRQRGTNPSLGERHLLFQRHLRTLIDTGHHHLKAAFRRLLHEHGRLAGGDAKRASLVTDLLRHTTNANAVPNHKLHLLQWNTGFAGTHLRAKLYFIWVVPFLLGEKVQHRAFLHLKSS